MAPRLFVMNPDLAKKLYMESGVQPMRGGFEALTKVRRENGFFKNNLGLLKHSIKELFYQICVSFFTFDKGLYQLKCAESVF